jgi:ketosteroid isomerase-like protein
MLWKGTLDTKPIEAEAIGLTEIDECGKLVAIMVWDVGDRAAAFAAAHARFVAGEAAVAGGVHLILKFNRAVVRRDWEALRATLAPDFVLDDHRPLGLGALSREQHVESMKALTDLAPDAHVETFQILAWNRHGWATVSAWRGTIPEGGPFENLFVTFIMTDDDRIAHFEVFDVADAERALARFDELCAERDAVPPRRDAASSRARS